MHCGNKIIPINYNFQENLTACKLKVKFFTLPTYFAFTVPNKQSTYITLHILAHTNIL